MLITILAFVAFLGAMIYGTMTVPGRLARVRAAIAAAILIFAAIHAVNHDAAVYVTAALFTAFGAFAGLFIGFANHAGER
jgi:hypothetical protein